MASSRALQTFIKLRRAVNTLNSRLSSVLQREWGLTESQFGVLEALLHLGPMPQARLCEKLLVSGSNLTTVIDNLERNGWVRRVADPDDRRAWQVQLTEKGRHLIGQAFPRHAARVQALLRHLSPQEQEMLGRLCRKLGLAIVAEG